MSRSSQRVALLCIDPWLKLDGDYRPFNYPVRRIQAAIASHPRLRDVEVRVFDTRDRDPSALLGELERFDPDVVGASTYLWSFSAFLEVARAVKASRPDRKVYFGGPSARPEMFALEPFAPFSRYLDALVLGEGEEVIVELLTLPEATPAALRTIAGLALFDGERWVATEERGNVDLETLPSPFQMNLVPEGFTAHLETFRGCPLSCSFCQWGDLSQPARAFSKEYLVRELESFRRMKARGVTLVDAALNLNPRAFRNLVAAEREVGFLREGHFHTEIYPSHVTEDHLAFLEHVRADSVGIGLQSYDKDVLKRVERPFNEDRFEQVVRDVSRIVPDFVAEIIMGLPGDSPESFLRTLERVRKLPIGVRVYRCLVLPNALMSRGQPHFEMKFDPHTLQMDSCWGFPPGALQKLCNELDAMVKVEGGEALDGSNTWKFPSARDAELRRERREAHAAAARGTEVLPSVRSKLEGAVAAKAGEGWVLTAALHEGAAVTLHLFTPQGEVVLRAEKAEANKPSFRKAGGLAFGYRTPPWGAPSRETLTVLAALIDQWGPTLRDALALPDRTSLPLAR